MTNLPFTNSTLTQNQAQLLANQTNVQSAQQQGNTIATLTPVGPLLPGSSQQASTLAAGLVPDVSPVINKGNLPALKARFNTHLYNNTSNTRLQIGPLVFGPEVQDIKILEKKAIGVVQGVRTASDFLIEDGTGDADVQITLLFDGEEHMNSALKPLIALFRVSPVTSVDNQVIHDALYTEYTENNITSADQELLQNAKTNLLQASIDLKKNALWGLYNSKYPDAVDKQPEIDDTFFDMALSEGWIPDTGDVLDEDGNTVQTAREVFLNAFDHRLQHDTILDLSDQELTNEQIQRLTESFTGRRVDNTGYVPMAFMGIELQTHPELPQALVATVMLKRVNVGNFLHDFLQYRDVEGFPTPDARKAFWLNRAIDLYIEKYINDGFVNFDNFGNVKLSFHGENVELSLFKDSNAIEVMELNNTEDRTAVLQLSYGMYHKFHFCRLIGESYPTCQHMGTSSGVVRLNVSTDNQEMFRKLHAYKSAADFFVRHVERFSRFNGWQVDTYLTRIFNFTPDALAVRDETTLEFDRSYYPSEVVTATDDALPGLRNISIIFQETNPKFFDDFGFTIAKGGYSIQLLHTFFKQIFQQANDVRRSRAANNPATPLEGPDAQLNLYAYETVFGVGDHDLRMMLVNPDTIIAAIMERQVYENAEFVTNKDLQKQIWQELLRDSNLTGELNVAGTGFDVLIAQGASLLGVFDPISIRSELADQILARYFIFDESVAGRTAKSNVKRLLINLGEASDREELYMILSSNPYFQFTDEFCERLFSAVVQRRKVPITDRLYDRSGVVKAFHSFTIALEAKGVDLLTDEEDLAALAKRASHEEKIVVDNNGDFQLDSSVTTCYNDYYYITYGDLFNLAGTPFEDLDNWKRFAPKYRHLGIINNNPSFFQSGFDEWAVRQAQDAEAALADTPVPPSVYFYREDELSELQTELSTEYAQWFRKMGTMVLEIPFDIEYFERDPAGRLTGGTATAAAGTTNPQLSTFITNMVNRAESRNPNGWRDIQQSVMLQQLQHVMDTTGWDEERILEVIEDTNTNVSLSEEFFRRMSWFDGAAQNGVLVPFVMGRGMNSPVARYEKISGVAGEATVRAIIYGDQIQDYRDEEFRDFVAETVRKSASGQLSNVVISDANVDEVRAGMFKVTQAIPDNGNDLIKAFPVMRLYLIEDRGPSLLVQDNFYGYQAIESIDITLDKYDAALAVIRVADPFHLLQGTDFAINEKGQDLKNKLAFPTNGQFDDDMLERIKLRQGRAIQIRGGYASDPDHLDVLFTGRIAELQFGDTVTIVAQGWKAELMGKQVEFELHATANNSVKDLVVRTIRDSQPKGVGEVFSNEEFTAISRVAGDLNAADQVWQARIAGLGTNGGLSPESSGASLSPLGFTLVSNLNAGLDLRLKNVWVPDDDPLRFKFFKDLTKYGWQGSRWVVPLTPAWEVLEGASNYVWGYVCQVVPYDGEATIFFGRPEQLYYHTAGRARVGKALRSIRQKSTRELTRTFKQIIGGFFGSRHFGDLATHLRDSAAITFVDTSCDPITDNCFVEIWQELDSETHYTLQSTPEYLSFNRYRHMVLKHRTWETYTDDRGPAEHVYEASRNERLIELNYGHDFYNSEFESFKNLAEQFGNEKLTALFLLSSFFGISMSYLQKNIVDPVSFVGRMLSRATDFSFRDVRNDIAHWHTPETVVAALGESVAEEAQLDDPATLGFFESLVNPFGVDFDAGLTPEVILTNLEALQDGGDQELAKLEEAYYLPSREFFLRTDNRSIGYLKDAGVNEAYVDALAIYWDASGIDNKLGVFGKNIFEFNTWVHNGKRGIEYLSGVQVRVNEGGTAAWPTPREVHEAAIRWFQLLLQQQENIDHVRGQSGFYPGDTDFPECARQLGGDQLIDIMMNGNKTQIQDAIIRDLWRFRAFVYFFSIYVDSPLADSQAITDAAEEFRRDLTFDHSTIHNMKVFRDYHYIRSGIDILDNSLAASTREMHNTVVIRYPAELSTSNDVWYLPGFIEEPFSGDNDTVEVNAETEWTTWPRSDDGHIGMQFDDTITLEDKKIGVYSDLNVTRQEQAAMLATNVLVKMMRPMYRNTICILGRPIKPWDYIYLNDKYTDMLGMLDVERVIHHYDAQAGWTTKIVPHAVCEANPGNRQVQAAVFASKMDRIFEVADYAFTALMLASFIPTGGQSAVALTSFRAAFRASAGSTVARAKAAIGARAVTHQLQTLKRAFMSDTQRLLKNYIITQGILYGGHRVNRLFQANMRAGKDNLPVLFSPVLYKGAPLQAGLHGDELTYWSLGSKFHWAWKHTKEGFDDLFSSLGDMFNQTPSDDARLFNRLAGTEGLSAELQLPFSD